MISIDKDTGYFEKKKQPTKTHTPAELKLQSNFLI